MLVSVKNIQKVQSLNSPGLLDLSINSIAIETGNINTLMFLQANESWHPIMAAVHPANMATKIRLYMCITVLPIRLFPKIGVPQNGWFLGYPYFWKHLLNIPPPF